MMSLPYLVWELPPCCLNASRRFKVPMGWSYLLQDLWWQLKLGPVNAVARGTFHKHLVWDLTVLLHSAYRSRWFQNFLPLANHVMVVWSRGKVVLLTPEPIFRKIYLFHENRSCMISLVSRQTHTKYCVRYPIVNGRHEGLSRAGRPSCIVAALSHSQNRWEKRQCRIPRVAEARITT